MHLCLKNHPLVLIHLFTKQIVPSLCPESRIVDTKFVEIVSTVFHMCFVKYLLPSIICLRVHCIFLLCLFVCFIFIDTFLWACMNPESFSLFVHSLVCLTTHSFLNGFQQNLAVSLLLLCMLYLSYYCQPEVNT